MQNFEKENKKICKFLSINKNFKLKKNQEIKFNLERSKNNIFKYKKNLYKFEYDLISKRLKKYLHW